MNTEITIRTNIVTGEHFDKEGNFFSRSMPTASIKSKFRLFWNLYSDTPDAGNAAVDVSAWKKANYAGCGALVTCDNDYQHRCKGELVEAIKDDAENPAKITKVKIKFSGDAFVPQSGDIYLESRTPVSVASYTLSYSGFYKDPEDNYFFLVNYDGAGNFLSGSECYVSQEPFFQSVFVPEISNPENGVFVFDVSVYSSKLESAAETASGRNIACNGIEILPYIVDDNNIYSELPSFLCDTFSLTVNMGTAGDAPEITTEIENQIAAMVAAKTANLVEMIKAKQIYQYSENGTSWHEAFQTGDKYMRERKDIDGAEWSDAYPISPPAVFTNAITYEFETTEGQAAELWFYNTDIGIADDAQPQVTLWYYEEEDALKRVADTTYQAVWYEGGALKIEYYHAWIAGKWQLKLS